MRMTLGEIAAILGGRLIGDSGVTVENVRGIDEALEGDLTFVSNPKYLKKLETTRASAILVSAGTDSPGKNLILVDDPYVSLGRILAVFYPEDHGSSGIADGAFIEESAVVSEGATVHPGVYVGRRARIERGAVLYPGVFIGDDAVVGEDSILYPRVTVYRRCLIGKRVILHAGVVIGGDGFGFALPGSENIKIPQAGNVQIDDDVEIGANSTVDRATMGRTWIQRGVKIDNLVQIAHNVVIGENSVIVAQVGISGSTRLGRGVILGGQAGIVGHIEIGDRAMVAAQAGVHDDVPSGHVVSGSPHRPHREWLRIEACVTRLPEMRQTLKAMAKRIAALEEKLAAAGASSRDGK
ncbi:MAG: UDP-3-O-(3-hydroxymyristoyl)glucosamine N-acyltransferase [Deltaproteobacteria bacterium]|nr:UDP-3-O-(3-hydroxymyristoyl)glucosamine N-acyltransferase [Deltaproteobacteria bacterium]